MPPASSKDHYERGQLSPALLGLAMVFRAGLDGFTADRDTPVGRAAVASFCSADPPPPLKCDNDSGAAGGDPLRSAEAPLPISRACLSNEDAMKAVGWMARRN